MAIVSLKKHSGTPKYKQIVSSIEVAISDGTLKKGDQLPSLNAVKNAHKLSRDTVLTAFNELKNRGIIHSIVGKGYFVSSENVQLQQKIFLLFDEFNSFKEDLYNSFLEQLGDQVQVDIFFHHFNKDIFDKLILENVGSYSFYVLMPANLKNVKKTIQNLPKEKVYILDQLHQDLSSYAAIYQNFEKAIYEGLLSAVSAIKKYQKLVLVYAKDRQPKGILTGFQSFCREQEITNEIIPFIKNKNIQKGEVYIVLEDKTLIQFIKKAQEGNLILADDIGVISYNDTLLKEVVAKGITTISTDFNFMGKRLAKMILDKEQISIENPSSLILRNSL